MGIFNSKRNKFVQTVLCSQCLNKFWLYWISDSEKIHSMETTLMLHWQSSVYWFMSVYQKPFNNSRCDVTYRRLFFYQRSAHWFLSVSQKSPCNSCCNVAYRRLFFYHWLAHRPAYACNTDDRLVEPHCSMFLQASLAFSIHHMSNLMHHSHVCLCCKSNIFPRFDSHTWTVF